MPNLVNVSYHQTGKSTSTNTMGMREMQSRAFEARDAKYLQESGYKLDHIEAFDLFPMTQHMECVAGFSPVKQ